MKNIKALEQVARFDGRNCFVEVMVSGIPFNRVILNFKQYDKDAEAGSRTMADISIFIGMLEAERLSRDIMSGRISKLGVKELQKVKEGKVNYAQPVFQILGGTPGARRPDGIPQARVFDITPGTSQPWILCAKQGVGKETSEGLIAMISKPTSFVRVALTDDKLKEFAIALETVFHTWEYLRFVPLMHKSMLEAMKKQEKAFEAQKNRFAANAALKEAEIPD